MSLRNRDLIGRVPLFDGLSGPEVELLAERALEKRFDPGTVLFSEGEPCAGLYLILEGSVKIFKSSASGREITLAVERAPASVAEVPLFDGGAYPASVAAIERVTAGLIHTRDFQQVCRQFPEVSIKMLAAVGGRLRQLLGIIETVTFGSVRQRLAGLLLEEAELAGEENFSLPATHQELASRLGTVREVVSRNLGRFQMEAFIRLSGRQVQILDRAGLRREADTEL